MGYVERNADSLYMEIFMKILLNFSRIIAGLALVCAVQVCAMTHVVERPSAFKMVQGFATEFATKAVVVIPNVASYVVKKTLGRIPTVKTHVTLADLYKAKKEAAFDYVFGQIDYVPKYVQIKNGEIEWTRPAYANVKKVGLPVFQSVHEFLVLHKTTAGLLSFTKNLGRSAAIVAGLYYATKKIYNVFAHKDESVVIDPVLEGSEPQESDVK